MSALSPCRLPQALCLALAIALGGPAGAQGVAHQHGAMPSTSSMPSEPGQGAFAAIAEIVALLEADPHTDWSRVDIATLREHLVDMNALVLEAHALETAIPGGVEIAVSATGRAREAVGRMVPAHARQLDRRPGWRATARVTDEGAVLRVTASDGADTAKIRALGFFGLMALEQHHQAHHRAMATGADPHAH